MSHEHGILPEFSSTLILDLPPRGMAFLHRIARIAGVPVEKIAADLLLTALTQEAENIVALVQSAYPEDVTAAAQAMRTDIQSSPTPDEPKLTLSPDELEQAARENADLLAPEEN